MNQWYVFAVCDDQSDLHDVVRVLAVIVESFDANVSAVIYKREKNPHSDGYGRDRADYYIFFF